MLTKMAFMPMLKQFLLDHGEVYTVRRFKMAEKDVEVKDVGLCHRTPIMSITSKEQLESYIGLSGFSTVQAWWSKILYFIPSKEDPKYLYHVVRKEEGKEIG